MNANTNAERANRKLVLVTVTILLIAAIAVGCSDDTVEPTARIEASPASLHFDDTISVEGSISITVKNGANCPISISSSDDWIIVSPKSGKGILATTITVNPYDLSPGLYSGEISIACPGTVNSPQIVSVTYRRVEGPPDICINPSTRYFWAVQNGAIPELSTFDIKNCGGKLLHWQIESDCNWLTIGSEEGWLSAGDVTSVSLQPDRTNLDFGEHSCRVTVTSDQPGVEDEELDVTYEIKGPIIENNDPPLSFSAPQDGILPAVQTVSVQNSGPGTFSIATLEVETESGGNWLQVGNVEYPDPSNVNQFRFDVQPKTTDLEPKTYNGKVKVKVTNAENSPLTVDVTYRVIGPCIEAIPDELEFRVARNDPIPAPQSFDIKNPCGGTLNWEVSEEAAWLDLTPRNGTASANRDGSVNVNITTTDLEPDTYKGEVTIRSIGYATEERHVVVTLIVEPGPEIHAYPSILTFAVVQGNPRPAAKSFTIENTGGGELNWRITSGADWLELDQTEDISNLAEISVRPTRTDLSVDTHTDLITITSINATNSPQIVEVRYVISPKPPEICYETDWGDECIFKIQQGSSLPTPRNLHIWNCGGGDLNWTVQVPAFLTADPVEGINDGIVKIGIATTNLPVGKHIGEIVISAPDASESEERITVCIEILPQL